VRQAVAVVADHQAVHIPEAHHQGVHQGVLVEVVEAGDSIFNQNKQNNIL
jgi:hypothetical protein